MEEKLRQSHEVGVICALFWAALSLRVTEAESQLGKEIAVIHDEWADLSPAGLRHVDLHAKTAFYDAASAHDLRVSYTRADLNSLRERIDWNSSSLAGVVMLGDCRLGRKMIALADREGIPSLALFTQACDYDRKLSNVLPLYVFEFYRSYDCAVPVLKSWLSREVSRSPSTKPIALRYSPINRIKTQNYREEFLSCGGLNSTTSNRTFDPESVPPRLQLQLAKDFLSGRQLKIATINRPPFIILTMEGDEISAAEGICIMMLDSLAERYNFTYKLFLPYDGNWGAMMPNGSFNGMVGMVQRHWMDFAMATITITQIRETVIDFTHAFYEEPTAILIPPAREQNNFLAFLEPFTWQVWLLILISILIVGPITWLLASAVDMPVLYPHNQDSTPQPLSAYVWDCAFSLIAQGNTMRQSEPARMLSAFWWVYCITIIYTYNGTLIAFLTIPRLTNLINSLDELANQREVLWTYRSNSAHQMLFANAPAPGTYNKIGRLLAERPDLLVKTDQLGVEAVLGGHIAFIKEKSWLDFAMESDYLSTKQCRLSLVNHYFFSAGYGWALQSGSPFLRLFNREFLTMAQSGLKENWKQRYWPKPNECTAGGRAATGPKPLQLKNFSGHFFIFGVGQLLALICFVSERVYYAFIK